ncbi:unnamed protein product [Paramecium octaurelia]|uniref:Uncharacterized protein n=1 Tax=Paramecium octaurelia TaxID=43137 RepID=A0A8S1XDM1_PAROT|nr:unnamed protein product [Paramecium octaurelia]
MNVIECELKVDVNPGWVKFSIMKVPLREKIINYTFFIVNSKKMHSYLEIIKGKLVIHRQDQFPRMEHIEVPCRQIRIQQIPQAFFHQIELKIPRKIQEEIRDFQQ